LAGAWRDDGGSFDMPVADALVAAFDPELQAIDVVEEAGTVTSMASDVLVARQQALAEIAATLRTNADVVARIELGGRRQRKGAVGTPPQGETELSIAAIWQEVLHIDAIGRDDNFFEVGGNSLLLVQVNGKLIERFGRDIAITTLFQYPTIASLGQHLSTAGDVTQNHAQVQARASNARQQLQQRMQRLGGMRR
jgi:acyl carrier protein